MKCGYNYSQPSSSFPSPPSQVPLPQPEKDEFWTEDISSFSSPQQQIPLPRHSSPKTSQNSFPIVAVFALVVLLGVFGIVAFVVFQAWTAQQAEKNNRPKIDISTIGYNTSSDTSYPTQNSELQAQRQSIVNQAFSLKAGHLSSYKFTIPKSSGVGTVVGNFVASGGGDDIFVVITNETGLTNIKSGNNYKAYYDSGKVSADDINVNLSPGTYYIVFSNAHSLMTPKAVNADISVEY